MTAPQPPQHDDPFTETRTQMLQALAVLATLSEAAARWAAVGVQNRASRAENAQRADRMSGLTRSEADRLADDASREQARADREHIALAFDDEWLSRADLNQTANLWRIATMHAAGGDEWARNAMANAEDRLAHLRPGLMDFYRQFRAEGHLPAEAMRAAAYGMWMQVDNSTLGPQARAHPARQPTGLGPGANGRALGPGGPVLNDLDAAIRQEVADLAPSVDPQIVDQLQRQWRSQGLVPAADAAELLAQHARHLLHTAAQGGPPSGTATIRHGVARPGTDPQGQIVYDTIDVPVPTGQAGLQIAGQHADNLAQQAQADAAAARHLAGFAGQEHDQGAAAYGTPDLAATPVNEHRAGLAAGHVDHGHAEHDRAGADQRRRMGQAFPPLTYVQQNHPELATKQAAPTVPTQEKGRRR